MQLQRSEVLAFMRSNKYAVQGSASAAGTPQAAVVGVAVTDDFVVIFDTLDSTRKARNLVLNPAIAFVFGGLHAGDERTVQYEGIADFPQGAELARVQADYFKVFPDGPSRLTWPEITHVRVKPRWLRYSDFNQSPPLIAEFGFQPVP
ncbi:MAG TPA: pyridoxamine 5'-phosphate oxidase family protein [Steroidobacteraceae bacterium]|nr:pyridoxamine 5'-phosphate oxidase family protein [Steroidobacteraceae bacterium]